MKKTITILVLFLFFQGFTQQKELTLNDAVQNYYIGLYPETLYSLQFVSDTQYVNRVGSEYVIKNLETDAVESKIALSTLQKTFKDLKHLPRILQIDEKDFTFINNHSIITYNYKTNNKVNEIVYDEKAQNTDYENKTARVAYTIDNNLYIATPSNAKIEVTHFSDKNIVAGQAIARYEFGISKGTFWSPNGNYLAFYQKDESNVTDYPLVDITTYPATLNNIKYPMAGQGSEIAKIGIYDVANNKVTYLDIDTTDEHYLTNLSWTPDEKQVLIAEVNRGQNKYELKSYSIKNGKKRKILFTETNKRWVEPENDAVFIPNSTTKFLWLSEKDGFKNIYLLDTKSKCNKQITNFKFVIKSILGFDKTGDNVYVSTTGKDGRETQVYKVLIDNGQFSKVTTRKGTHRVQYKNDYLLDNFSSLEVPRDISIIQIGKGKRSILTAKDPLKDYKIGTTEFVTLKSKEGFDLFGRLIKPANFNPSKKYPVLVYVYGGTHAQLVTNSWLGGASLWMHWLATQKEYLVFTLDNRGSANRGFAFESVIHRNAGDAAIEDQLIGIDYLKKLGYVDEKRIAVHGWSYGGFMASSLLLRNPKVFTTAVAGGPVTNWKYYEVMYGERYMDTPQENEAGYAKARVGKYLENLGDNKLLLIHGSADPTVVPQHSMTLLKEAVEKNVQIDFFTYPMHPHNVRGKDRTHLMTKVLNYILENNK